MLPPIPVATIKAQLGEVGFTRSKAKGAGDCYPLSVMAGFEITAKAAREPTAVTTASVREMREGSIGLLAGDDPIDGIEATVFRAGERLPEDAADALDSLEPWLHPGFWNNGNGNNSASFMLGVAVHLERPVAVLERKGRTFLNPAKVYGARDAHGALLHSDAKPGAPETIPTFKPVPVADLIETLRANPTSHSVLEFNGSNHFDPWILKRSLRAAAEAEVEVETVEAEAAEAAGVEAETEVETAEAEAARVAAEMEEEGEEEEAAAAVEAGEEAEVEQEEQEWTPLPGGPWSAWLMRKSRQPASGDVRVFAVAASLSTLWAGGAVKFVDVPGGPVDGVVCNIPPCTSRSATTKDLIFPLRLNKEGAPGDTFTIHKVFYKLPSPCASPPPPPSRPQRDRKRKAHYGDNGEHDRSYHTTPAARKASVDPSLEMGIPDYAAPGEEVWAMASLSEP